MKTIKGNLIMKKDMIFNGDLKVEGNILGKNGNIFNLRVNGNLNCRNLNCRNLTCRNLDCWNLNCWNLTCFDLNCGNLDCWDLDCVNLDCRNLEFYAIAIAYYSFKCKSWKATRKKFIIKCLDGEIEGKELSGEKDDNN